MTCSVCGQKHDELKSLAPDCLSAYISSDEYKEYQQKIKAALKEWAKDRAVPYVRRLPRWP